MIIGFCQKGRGESSAAGDFEIIEVNTNALIYVKKSPLTPA